MLEQMDGSYDNPFKFNAKELDEDTGLYYYGARYYNPRISIWYGVDPLAIYNPVMETEFYGNGQHNGGVFHWGNNNPYIYTNQNPIVYTDPNGKQTKVTTSAGKIFNYDKLAENYRTGVAKMEANGANSGSKNQQRWQGLVGKNACAINMSYAMNSSGYLIPEHKTNSNRYTWTGGQTRSNNGDKPYQYILGATEMGGYLSDKLGKPTLEFKPGDDLDTFIKKFDAYKNFKGIIYIKSGDTDTYGATGHVDLLYSDWGNDPHIYQTDQELDDYIESRDSHGLSSWFSDAKLSVSVWITEYEKKDVKKK